MATVTNFQEPHSSLVRQCISPTVNWSDRPLVRQSIGPTYLLNSSTRNVSSDELQRAMYSLLFRQCIGPTVRWSDSPLNRSRMNGNSDKLSRAIQFIGPTVHWSDSPVHWSDISTE